MEPGSLQHKIELIIGLFIVMVMAQAFIPTFLKGDYGWMFVLAILVLIVVIIIAIISKAPEPIKEIIRRRRIIIED